MGYLVVGLEVRNDIVRNDVVGVNVEEKVGIGGGDISSPRLASEVTCDTSMILLIPFHHRCCLHHRRIY